MLVRDLLNLSEEIGEFYSENIENEMKDQLNEIMEMLETYFKNKCIDEGTVLSNSVYKSIIPFSFKTRVKSKISIEEKVIRNDIKFSSIDRNSILSEFDDLIGITILTTTMGYQDLAHKYLLSFVKENEEKIKLVGNNEVKKPLFGNKRIQYHHLKLIYNSYPVEIQIKSIFLSAFADIEHTLFYKDHDIHELKSYNKKIMHSLAPILIDLEEILHGIYTHDKSYIELESLKTNIYNYICENKKKIFNIEEDEDRGRLNFAINKAAELLSIYYIGKEEAFNNTEDLEGIIEGLDFNIIQFLYSESLQFIIVSSLLSGDSKFFEIYLRAELINDNNYSEKVSILDEYLTRFLNSIDYLSKNSGFKSFEILKNIKLKSIFELFINVTETFDEKFEESLEDIEVDIKQFVDACLVIPHLVKDKKELRDSGSSEVEDYFLSKENQEIISYNLSENILKYILEEWNNK